MIGRRGFLGLLPVAGAVAAGVRVTPPEPKPPRDPLFADKVDALYKAEDWLHAYRGDAMKGNNVACWTALEIQIDRVRLAQLDLGAPLRPRQL